MCVCDCALNGYLIYCSARTLTAGIWYGRSFTCVYSGIVMLSSVTAVPAEVRCCVKHKHNQIVLASETAHTHAHKRTRIYYIQYCTFDFSLARFERRFYLSMYIFHRCAVTIKKTAGGQLRMIMNGSNEIALKIWVQVTKRQKSLLRYASAVVRQRVRCPTTYNAVIHRVCPRQSALLSLGLLANVRTSSDAIVTGKRSVQWSIMLSRNCSGVVAHWMLQTTAKLSRIVC